MAIRSGASLAGESVTSLLSTQLRPISLVYCPAVFLRGASRPPNRWPSWPHLEGSEDRGLLIVPFGQSGRGTQEAQARELLPPRDMRLGVVCSPLPDTVCSPGSLTEAVSLLCAKADVVLCC